MIVYSIGLMVENVVGWTSEPKDAPMNIPMAFPESRKQSVASVVLSRLRILVATVTYRDTTADVEPRPYSFQTECECPDDCPRDHENE
jgi:hypothetical protein